ncbi:MAG: ATP-dependent Lon protease [Actinomycetota bacterium]|jgi:ATP-dependent Lon protease|nr:ATP-dependent Lon protease [Actinomycetota bacterium]
MEKNVAETKTLHLPVVSLEEGVVLPHMVVTLALTSPDTRGAISAAQGAEGLVLLLPNVDGKHARIGTVGQVEEMTRLPNGDEVCVVRGLYRGIVGSGVPSDSSALWVQVTPSPDPDEYADGTRELAQLYLALVENIIESRGGSGAFLRAISDPGQLADTAGYSPRLTVEQKVEVLETVDVAERLDKLIEWAKDQLGEISLKDRIREEVTEGMEKTQREYLLRQQLEAIKRELGEDGGSTTDEYRTRVADAGMPEAVRTEVERELDRLERTSEQNPEYGYIRNYIDWMLDIPWNSRSDDNFDLDEARRVLDADHTGLEDVKDRIIELLAVRKLRHDRGLVEVGGRGSGAIITLVGPPGVGKTSLGESVARSMGRKFARVSLGGIHDEADIRGHRRTYVGALPGRIVRALKEAGTKNPVIMLDEIDKVGNDWRGDPSSALLEVLDPAQNHSFRDHYLEVDLDLSEVLFIPTANVIETIPGPLLDRMEVVRLDGYTEEEKVSIARDHLVGRQLERNGLKSEEVNLSDDALRKVIADHTREAGVRNLEREIGKVLRKAATKIAGGATGSPVEIDEAAIREYLGRPKFHFEAAERTSVPGVATGLAVTGHGGDVLFVEATIMEGEAGLTLTGQLGDVMKESAQIALSYIRSHSAQLSIDPGFEKKRIHLHVPAGAVPKDGPSAGITMTTALVSLLTGRPVRSIVGMTGEVTLQGRVLPIGGLKQKVLAAHRAGLKEVVLPERNEPDLDDLPDAIRNDMTFHIASDVHQVLEAALSTEESAADRAA